MKKYNSFVDADLSEELSHTFTEMLKRGYILIPEGMIRQGIKKVFATEDRITLKSCELHPSGIYLTLRVKQMGVQLTFNLIIMLSRIVINCQKQQIEFKFSDEKLLGDNLLGKLVLVVIGGLLSKVVSRKILNNQLVIESEVDQECGRGVLDLNSLKELWFLKKQLPILKKKVLDVVSIEDVEHVSGGVKLKVNLSL